MKRAAFLLGFMLLAIPAAAQFNTIWGVTTGQFGFGNISLTGNLTLSISPATATSGIIYKGAVPWLHDYSPAGSTGGNVFLGVAAGNLTGSMGGEGTVGGAMNVAIGYQAYSAITHGHNNVFIGDTAGAYVTGAVGDVVIGSGAASAAYGANFVTAVGYSAGQTSNSGTSDTFLGRGADVVADGPTQAVAIGYNAKVATSNTAVIGSNALTDAYFGSVAPTATVHAAAYTAGSGNTAGMTTVVTVRNSGGLADCTMTYTGGILTATTCSHT